ncbi:MAG: site-2 protease family protein [Acidobacteria bacterium]|nr:site-2 protease family protein [Acidobacteriota bacterium]
MWFIEIIAYIAALFFLVKGLQYAIVWARLMQRRNQLPYNECVDSSQVPENLNPIWAQTHKALDSLGFQYAYSQKATQTNKVAFYQIYVHPNIPAFASVSSTLLPGWIRSFDVIFTSIFDNGKTMITTDCLDNITLPLPKNFQTNTYYFADLSKQWLVHQQWINQIRQKEDTEAIYCTVEEFLQNQNSFAKEALSYQIENGWAVEVGSEGEWRYSAKGAAKLLAPIFYVSKKLTEISKKISKEQSKNITENKSNVSDSTSFLGESNTQAQLNADILAFEQAIADENNRVKWGWVTKAGLFLVSVVVAALAFGISFSWQTVFILLGVLLIHELGHLAGMVLFGFKDTQVLFLPFLGAVTIGDKEDATPLQKLVIYLLGPVPGVIGGFVAAYIYLITFNQLWYEIALISIILNYINLLPILPLDGGRVLEALVYVRFPRAQTVIYIINSLVLFLAWWLLNDKIILFLAISTIISLPVQWQFSIAASRINRLLPKEHDRKIRLQTIFQVLTAPPFIKQTWAERYLLAKKLVSHFSNVMPTVKVMIIGGFIYLLMLGLPIYGLIGWVAVDWWSARNYTSTNTSIEEPIEKLIEKPDWETKLKQLTDPAKRWDVLIEAGDWQLEEDYESDSNATLEKTKQYYLEAFEIAKGFGLKDPRYLESLNRLAGVLPEKEVKDYYLQALSQMEKGFDKNDIQIASLLERLAFLPKKRSDLIRTQFLINSEKK